MSISLHLLTRFPPIGFGQLRVEAKAEGYGHIERLVEEWENRTVRFQLEGEALFAALLDDRLQGIGGVTHDPVLPAHEALRLRRLYVRPEGRRQGVGRALVQRLSRQALRHTPMLVANAGSFAAAALFEGCGFNSVLEPGYTHCLGRADLRD